MVRAMHAAAEDEECRSPQDAYRDDRELRTTNNPVVAVLEVVVVIAIGGVTILVIGVVAVAVVSLVVVVAVIVVVVDSVRANV